MRAKPLHGIRILDLTRFLAGPYATMLLADLGAEVVKVEAPEGGDPARRNGPFVHGVSTYFLSVNRGKKSITCNLKEARGRDLFLRLVDHADAVVENYRPGVMRALGLDWPVLRERNARLIYAACSGFGQTGPLAQRAAYDLVVQAMGGTVSVTGTPGGEPVRVGYSIGDLAGGMFTAMGLLAALIERGNSGRGQFLDVSMMDCQVALLENAVARYFATGEVAGPLGTKHPVVTPIQAYPTGDGYIVLAIGEERQWQRFCRVAGVAHLLTDPRFQEKNARTAHREELDEILRSLTAQRTTAEWTQLLEPTGIAYGEINRINEVVAHPQIQARGMIAEVPVGDGQETARLVASPMKLSETPVGPDAGPPALGEHNRTYYQELLGLSAEPCAELRQAGII
ncbi:MAG: CoA transferase [Candidatus Tectomicrobia bacterium]|nr:CoA transferase [Candidatus Tectomicrobia bacterium]